MFAKHLSSDEPLSGLAVADRPEPTVPDGWEVVSVRAASLNHHDLWSLRGVGLSEDALPMILGCDAAGMDSAGNEVVVHSVISDPDWRGDETLDPRRSILSERFAGTFAEQVVVPQRNLVPKPPELSFAEAACLPTAWLTAYRMLFTRARGGAGIDAARAGRGRRRGDGADRARARGGPAGVGDLALRGEACARAGAGRRRRLRAGRAAPGARRRGRRDGRRRDVGALPEVSPAGRRAGDLRRDERPEPAGVR